MMFRAKKMVSSFIVGRYTSMLFITGCLYYYPYQRLDHTGWLFEVRSTPVCITADRYA